MDELRDYYITVDTGDGIVTFVEVNCTSEDDARDKVMSSQHEKKEFGMAGEIITIEDYPPTFFTQGVKLESNPHLSDVDLTDEYYSKTCLVRIDQSIIEDAISHREVWLQMFDQLLATAYVPSVRASLKHRKETFIRLLDSIVEDQTVCAQYPEPSQQFCFALFKEGSWIHRDYLSIHPNANQEFTWADQAMIDNLEF